MEREKATEELVKLYAEHGDCGDEEKHLTS